MSNNRKIFSVMRSVGLVGILAFIVFIEWRVVLGGRGGGGGWMMEQLLALISLLLLPYFWAMPALALVGHIGKRRIDKRAAKADAEE